TGRPIVFAPRLGCYRPLHSFPTRRSSDLQRLLQTDVVDLDDDAVDLVDHVVAVLAGVGDEVLDLVDRLEDLEVVADRQPPGSELLIDLGLVGRFRVRDIGRGPHGDAVDEHVQGPARGAGRVLLPQGSGRGGARVRGRRLALVDEGGVEFGELLDGEEHLTADLDLRRRVVRVEPVRDVGDGAHVRGDVLADASVAAGGGADQVPVAVEQVDGE